MRRLVVAVALLLVWPSGAVAASLGSGRTSYRTYDDYLSEIRSLVAGAPGLARRVVLPVRSVEGREIEGVEISSGVGAPSDGRPVQLVIGLTHAREWPSGEVAMEYARDLVARRSDPRVAALLSGLRTIVVPVSNPDGFVATLTGQPLRRRNCRAVVPAEAALPCSGRSGVDLNRNYGAYWGGNGASVAADSDTYRGAGPWSEPEAQAVHQLSASLPVTGVVSLHSVAALVLRPPGFRALGLSPDEAALKRLGDAMGVATGYVSEYAADLYEATGALEDWNYVAQGAFGYTVELGDGDGDRQFQGAYRTHVVDQYLGAGRGGVRLALELAGDEARDVRDHVVVSGTAPAGRVLRLSRTFDTFTSPVCRSDALDGAGSCTPVAPAYGVADGLSIGLVVGASGRFTWHVGPSTRPFVLKRGQRESWTLECLDGTAVVGRTSFVAGRGSLVRVTSACGSGMRARVAKNPDAVLVRLTGVSLRSGRVRASVVCARGCVARARVRRSGRVVATARMVLAGGVGSPLALRARRGDSLGVSVVDDVGEKRSASRRL